MTVKTVSAAQSVATAGDAYISRDDATRSWTIGNTGIRATFLVANRELELLQLVNPATGRNWQPKASPDTFTTIAGRASPLGAPDGGYQFVDIKASSTDRFVQLAVRYAQRDTHLEVTRLYVVYAGVPALETWTRFETARAADIEVSDLNVWHLTVAGRDIQWINGLLGDAMDVVQEDSFSLQQHTMHQGDVIVLGSESRSSQRDVPYFKIESNGEALVGGLQWSGAWNLTLTGQSSATEFTFGLAPMTTAVNPSRPIETPHGFLAVVNRTQDGSAVIQNYVRNGIRGGRGFEALITYNTWYAYGTRIDADAMMQEINHVAELGAELFVLDAGWYAGAGRDGIWDFTSGLGDFNADESRFPGKLTDLSDYAHSLGMKFGLWVEPERIALDTLKRDDSVDERWLATVDGAYEPGVETPRAGQLCFSSAAARAWILAQLVTLIDRVQPDYLKWDNNFWVNCNRPGHGHDDADGNFAHVTGLYDVLTELRRRYPNLLIENVSGGGNRIDYGMLRFTDVGWMDDRTAPSLHVRHNFEGLSSAMPPSYLFSFVIDHNSESLSYGQDIPLYIRSRMPGVFGLTFKTAELRPSVAKTIGDHIALYKRLRKTIQQGSVVLLTRQASAENPPPWDVIQETDGSGQTLIFAFQVDPGTERITLKPYGLHEESTYDVESIDVGQLGSASGADLMESGVELIASPTSAAHMLILKERPE